MVGRNGDRQPINLQINVCLTQRIIVHELLHTLGFFHMQNSFKRDGFVRIAKENTRFVDLGNFDKYDSEFLSHFGNEYDIKSILHFSAYAFTKNGFATIIPNVSYALEDRRYLAFYFIKGLCVFFCCCI